MSSRTSPSQLPDAAELLDILRHESPRRALRHDFLDLHQEIWAGYWELTRQAGTICEWTTDYANYSLKALDLAANHTQQALLKYIASNPEPTDLYAAVYDSLLPTQDPSPSELIFVHGAATDIRVKKAVDLYHGGTASRLLLSGNRPYYGPKSEPEANRMARVAKAAGVPGKDIIIEAASITIPDNVKRSIDRLEQLDWRPAVITVIATSYVLLRSSMEWYKYAPWPLEVKLVAPAIHDQRFSREHWQEDEQVRSLVLNEYIKMVFESRIDLLRADKDFVI